MADKGPFLQRLVRRVFYKYYARNLLFAAALLLAAAIGAFVESRSRSQSSS